VLTGTRVGGVPQELEDVPLGDVAKPPLRHPPSAPAANPNPNPAAGGRRLQLERVRSIDSVRPELPDVAVSVRVVTGELKGLGSTT
jgi:hypothetical protein